MVNTHRLRKGTGKVNDTERAEQLVKRLRTTQTAKMLFTRPPKAEKQKAFFLVLSFSHHGKEPVEIKRKLCNVAHEKTEDIWLNFAKILALLLEEIDADFKNFSKVLVEVFIGAALGFRLKPLGQIQRAEHTILKIELLKVTPDPAVI